MTNQILIIGGAGYIGSHVNKMLTQKGYQTVVFDNMSYGHKEFLKWGTFVQGDLANKEELRKVFQQNSIQAVLHFGAFIAVGESVADPAKYYRNNVVNTVNLLDVMREFGVGELIFSSTAAVYGYPLESPITEAHPIQPINPYGHSKAMVETIVADYSSAYDMRYVFLRYFNACGADPDGEIGEWHEPETHLIPLVLDAVSGRRENVKVFGTDYDTPDGTCVRDYIHVNDLADAHVSALDYLQQGKPSDVFNLGNGTGFSVREVIAAVERVTGKVVPVVEAARRDGDSTVLIGSSDKIRSVLGWKPKYDNLDQIVDTAWKWHKVKFL